jgi:hypothetical protein
MPVKALQAAAMAESAGHGEHGARLAGRFTDNRPDRSLDPCRCSKVCFFSWRRSCCQRELQALYARVVKRIAAMTPRERIATMERAGIYTKRGKLNNTVVETRVLQYFRTEAASGRLFFLL